MSLKTKKTSYTKGFKERDDPDDRGSLDLSTNRQSWNEPVTRTIFDPDDSDDECYTSASLQAKGRRTRIQRDEIKDKLKEGDHIAWQRSYGIWHHALVVGFDDSSGKLKLIHRNKGLKEEPINVYKQNGNLFRIEYSKQTLKNNPPQEVIKRAREVIEMGKEKYKLFTNNCEHFVTKCKTGNKKDSQQVRHARQHVACSAVSTGLHNFEEVVKYTCNAVKRVCEVSKSIGKHSGIVARSEIKNGTNVAVAETIETATKKKDWCGAGFATLWETAHCGYDIYKMKQCKDRGGMSDRDFKATVTERVTAATGAIIGIKFGAAAGACIGRAIPVIGSAACSYIGSVVGRWIGPAVSKVAGTVIGRWFGSWW